MSYLGARADRVRELSAHVAALENAASPDDRYRRADTYRVDPDLRANLAVWATLHGSLRAEGLTDIEHDWQKHLWHQLHAATADIEYPPAPPASDGSLHTFWSTSTARRVDPPSPDLAPRISTAPRLAPRAPSRGVSR